jgi:hypothetical protein
VCHRHPESHRASLAKLLDNVMAEYITVLIGMSNLILCGVLMLIPVANGSDQSKPPPPSIMKDSE